MRWAGPDLSAYADRRTTLFGAAREFGTAVRAEVRSGPSWPTYVDHMCEPDSIFQGGMLDWALLALLPLAGALGAIRGRRLYLGGYPRLRHWFKVVRDGLVVLAVLVLAVGVVVNLVHACGPSGAASAPSSQR